MKTKILIFLTILLCSYVKQPTVTQDANIQNTDVKIQIAILLDTSSSMDGLIDQAKSQLWKIVNELSRSQYLKEIPTLEIALYEYGNDHLSNSSGFIRQVSDLTTDLDKISEDLFSLKTYGGSEYCGKVIKNAMDELDWSKSDNDLRFIFIAGNEEFTQGNVNYKTVSEYAKDKNIIVNTIFCGDYEEGIRISWKDGAEISGGKYMNINHNMKIAYIETPYDSIIVALNSKLNSTYISYGSTGKEKKARQEVQDANAATYGGSNSAERAVSKSSVAYDNSEWDLVDAVKEDAEIIEDIDDDELPVELQGKTTEEITLYVAEKQAEREEIQKQIIETNTKRETYIAEQKKNSSEENSLDEVILKAIKEQAEAKGFTFEE